MKAGKYTLRELFGNSHLNQIIIPEIQRDYVWPENQVKNLLQSLIGSIQGHKEQWEGYRKLKNFSEFEIGGLPNVSTEVVESFNDYYRYFECANNIGFIYAYNDEQFPGKYFLIDGQQRLTTIYLILLALVGNDTMDDFDKYCLCGLLPKIDFKVREASHNFLSNFVKFITKGGTIETVKNQNWYYNCYENDVTIKSIIRNFKFIKSELAKENIPKRDFFTYLLDFVEFWYFDTSKSEQGEELYIFMNARGEQVQLNENIKADLLGKLNISDVWVANIFEREDYKKNYSESIADFKKYWGKKWEQWQDYFWNSRNKKDPDSNADKGFNEFLRWIYIIDKIVSNPNDKIDRTKKLFDTVKFDFSTLNIYQVEQYFGSVKELFGISRSYINQNWLAGITSRDEEDDNEVKTKGSTLISKLVLFRLLPVIYYKNIFSNSTEKDLGRVIRFFYNLSKKRSTIGKTPDVSCIRAIQALVLLNKNNKTDIADLSDIGNKEISDTILTEEEFFKLNLYKSLSEDERIKVEVSFFELEDYSSNEGEIKHFILLAQNFEKEECADSIETKINSTFDFVNFEKVKKSFLELLPIDISGHDDLWGNLIPTSSFRQSNDRLLWDGLSNNFKLVRKSDFLNIVLKFSKSGLSKELFLKSLGSDFLKRYKDEEISKENSVKLQLYIYYLILKSKNRWYWDWDVYANFIIFENDERTEACYLFDKKNSFQIYSSAYSYAIDKLINKNIDKSDLEPLI